MCKVYFVAAIVQCWVLLLGCNAVYCEVMRKLSSVVSGRCSTLTLRRTYIVGLFLEATTPFSVNTPALLPTSAQ